jgi:hypothetical protein
MLNDILNFFDDTFNGSKSRYEKGCELHRQKQYLEATTVFLQIISKHPQAGLKLAEAKFEIALLTLNSQKNESTAYKQFEEIFSIKNSIPSTFDKKQFEGVEKKCKIQLGNIRYKNGVETEREKKYSTAISHYLKALEFLDSTNSTENYFKALSRLEISKLKEGKIPDSSNIEVLQKQTTPFQQDLFYRYTLYLLKNNEIKKAENILSKHIDFTSKEVEQLKEHCKNYYKLAALDTVNNINNSVEQLYQNDFPITETKKLFDDLSSKVPSVNKVSKETAKKVEELKPSLFNKLLSKYFSENLFEEALKHITTYSNFHKQPELIKNIGIAALRLADNNQITKSNYSTVISSWLTSIHSDRAILKSLEQTTWDDEFTFTLCESIGTNYRIDFDLENVNYDEVSPTNISIGATQRELLQSFENILQSNIADQQLANEAQEFYSTEKQAIEKIIQIIPSDITYATPFFAKQNKLSSLILEELENSYNSDDDEEALQVGILFADEKTPQVISEYQSVTQIINDIIKAIKKESKTEINNLTSTVNQKLVSKFNSIKETTEDKILSALATKIEEDDENEKLISIMVNTLNFSPTSQKLREQFSKYVMNLCVSKVNDDRLDNADALKYLHWAIRATNKNQRVANNLATIIKFSLMDILHDRTTRTAEIFKAVEEIKELNYETIKIACRELSETRNEILEQLGADTRLNIETGFNLNDRGRTLKKVLDYMKVLSGDNSGGNDLLSLLRTIR